MGAAESFNYMVEKWAENHHPKEPEFPWEELRSKCSPGDNWYCGFVGCFFSFNFQMTHHHATKLLKLANRN